eukprot:1160803-Pelagomonas_calceolata.AAC.17
MQGAVHTSMPLCHPAGPCWGPVGKRSAKNESVRACGELFSVRVRQGSLRSMGEAHCLPSHAHGTMDVQAVVQVSNKHATCCMGGHGTATPAGIQVQSMVAWQAELLRHKRIWLQKCSGKRRHPGQVAVHTGKIDQAQEATGVNFLYFYGQIGKVRYMRPWRKNC